MIVVDRLTRIFTKGRGKIAAVSQLSFQVTPGQVYGLLGPNGAGKTTTLRMILGLLEPTSGEATIDGFNVTKDPDEVKRRIGYASASVGVYPWLTPREMLVFVGDLYDMPLAQTKQNIEELSELLGLQEILDQRSATLSTGQKQRVNLARALIHDPPVMLMDEPTLGLDIVASSVVFDYIGHLKERNKAVIVCTHRLDEAQRICNQFGLLHHGELRHEGTIEEIEAATGQSQLTDVFLDLLKSEKDKASQQPEDDMAIASPEYS